MISRARKAKKAALHQAMNGGATTASLRAYVEGRG